MSTLKTAAEILTDLTSSMSGKKSYVTNVQKTVFSVSTAMAAAQGLLSASEEVCNIMDFVQASWGPSMTPYPMQRLLLKCIYKLPLDDTLKDIEIWDKTKTQLMAKLSEKEALEFLYKEGRTNVTPEDVVNPNLYFPTVVLILGRRGTKTTTCSWIASYECYKLLRIKDPQRYFGISPDQPLGIITVSTGKELATELFQGMAGIIERSPFFKPYIDKSLVRSLHLRPRSAVEDNRETRAGIELSAKPCSAKSLRGPQRVMAIMDEYGHFTVELAGQDRSDRSIWDAVQPSTADLTNPDGSPAGRMFAITTPLSRDTHAYQLMQAGMEDVKKPPEQRSGILTFNMPSVWINKKINVFVLRQAYMENAEKADQEYGAVFSDKVSAAFRNVDFKSDAKEGPSILVKRAWQTFMGLDIGGLSKGAKKDGTSWHIVHYEDKKWVSTYHEYWNPEKENVPFPLSFEDIADHTVKLWHEYGCQFGIYDQWNGYGLQTLLRQRGLREWSGMKSDPMMGSYMISFTDSLNSNMWKYVIDLAEAGQTQVYGEDLIKELYQLQAYQVGKDKIKVEAPSMAHYHDDQGDAWARAIWSAKMFFDENPGRLHPAMSAGRGAQPKGLTALQQRMKAVRTGNLNPRREGNRKFIERRDMMTRMRRVKPRKF